jgi:hypothetical protein
MRNDREADKELYIAPLAANYAPEAREALSDPMGYGTKYNSYGLLMLLGVIVTSVTMDCTTKSQLIEKMQIGSPGLSNDFCSQLIDLVTGTDPDIHLLKLCPNGHYDTLTQLT